MCRTLLSLHLLLVWRKVYSLCLCLPVGGKDDTKLACFSGFNLFREDRISVAAVSSEMALTGRSHSDNNPPIYFPPFFLFVSSLTSFFQTSFSFLFFDLIPILLFFKSHFLLPLSFISFFFGNFLQLYFWE